MTTNVFTDRLRSAADYIETHGWKKYKLGADGGPACLTGAVRYCAPQTGDEHLIRQVLAKRDRAEEWNDSDGVGSAEVIAFLRTADITDADLADTFGPQWEEIVDLVRAISGLSVERWRALRDAYAAAAAAAYAAYAYSAAAYAAAAAAAYAAYAYSAAYPAAYSAYSTYAAADAARGLAIRHLIGTNGFTQAHYDTLTGPWRKTIGRLHPDDAEMTA